MHSYLNYLTYLVNCDSEAVFNLDLRCTDLVQLQWVQNKLGQVFQAYRSG